MVHPLTLKLKKTETGISVVFLTLAVTLWNHTCALWH